MDPRDISREEGQDPELILTTDDLERVANPLSVVHGYTQLLQRRIRREQGIEDDELLRLLDLIEGASRSTKDALITLMVERHRDGTETPP